MKKDPTAFNPEAQALMARVGRSFSTSRELLAMADELKPALRFQARSRREWQLWRRKLLARLQAILGPSPHAVPLRPRVVERVDCGDHIRETVVYNTTPQMSVPAYVLLPKAARAARQRVPAVLTIHGHGYGAVDLVGLSPEEASGGNAHRNYALSVVRRGMVALAPDLRGFGRRAVDEDQLGVILRRLKLPEAAHFRRDMCNVQYLKANLLGYVYMRLQLHDLGCALSYLATRPEVDPARLGACGLSTGGMMTLFLSALDARVQCATISGTLTSYRSYALEIETTCGTQLPFGLLRYADLADVGCLIAPRPVCFESGAADFGFLQTVARREFVTVVVVADVHTGVGELLGDGVVSRSESLPQGSRPGLPREEAADRRVRAAPEQMVGNHLRRILLHAVQANVRDRALQSLAVENPLLLARIDRPDAGNLHALVAHGLDLRARRRKIDWGLAEVPHRVQLRPEPHRLRLGLRHCSPLPEPRVARHRVTPA